MKYRYNPPVLVKKIFSSFQWESKIEKILLTFDDGPIPETTPVILDTLSHYKIKAAFFCVGENIKKYPDLCRDLINEGHLVCSHTFNHTPITKLNRTDASEQLKKFNNLIKGDFDGDVLYFRPPHGKFNYSTVSLMKEMGLVNIMWSLLTYDFRNDLNLVKHAVDRCLQSNSIVVLHDSLKSKDIIADSIRYIVHESDARGLRIGVPAECLR